MRFLAAIFLLCAAGMLRASEVMPPVPTRYFNDYAKAVSPGVANELNRELEEFEKASSSQLVVAIYPTMQTDSSIEDYAQRIYQSWHPGQKKLNNGAILLVFLKEHKLRIQPGYGLEGAMPDAICKRIIDDEIAPHLRANDFDGGMAAGVHAMIKAAKGEYKGTGRTVRQQQRGHDGAGSWIVPLFIFGIFILINFARARGTGINSGGRSTYTPWNSGFGGGFGGGGGGGWSSGGGGDSGGFSGGGGDSGGGGASGSW